MRKFSKTLLILLMLLMLVTGVLVACVEVDPPDDIDPDDPTEVEYEAEELFDKMIASFGYTDASTNFDFTLDVVVNGKKYKLNLASNFGAVEGFELALRFLDEGNQLFGLYLYKGGIYFDANGQKLYLEDIDLTYILTALSKLDLPPINDLVDSILADLNLMEGLNFATAKNLIIMLLLSPGEYANVDGVETFSLNVNVNTLISTVLGLVKDGTVNLDSILAGAGIDLGDFSINEFLGDLDIPYIFAKIDCVIDNGRNTKLDLTIDVEETNIVISAGIQVSGSKIEIIPEDIEKYTPLSITNFKLNAELSLAGTSIDIGKLINTFSGQETLPENIIILDGSLDYLIEVKVDLSLKNNDDNKILVELKAAHQKDKVLVGIYMIDGELLISLDNAIPGVKVPNFKTKVDITSQLQVVEQLISSSVNGLVDMLPDLIPGAKPVIAMSSDEEGNAIISPTIGNLLNMVVGFIDMGDYVTIGGDFISIEISQGFFGKLSSLIGQAIEVPDFGKVDININLNEYGVENILVDLDMSDLGLTGSLNIKDMMFFYPIAGLEEDINTAIAGKDFVTNITDIIYGLLKGIDIDASLTATFKAGSYNISNLLQGFLPIELPSITFDKDEIVSLNLSSQISIDNVQIKKSVIKLVIEVAQDCSFAKAGEKISLYFQNGALYLDMSELKIMNISLPQLVMNVDIAQILVDAINGLGIDDAINGALGIAFADEESSDEPTQGVEYLGIVINKDTLSVATSTSVINQLLAFFDISFELPEFDLEATIADTIKISITGINEGVEDAINVELEISKIQGGVKDLVIDMSTLEENKYNNNIGMAVIDIVKKVDISGVLDFEVAQAQYNLSDLINKLIVGSGMEITVPIMLNLAQINGKVQFGIQWDIDADNTANSKVKIELKSEDGAIVYFGLYILNNDLYINVSGVKAKLANTYAIDAIMNAINNIDMSSLDLDKILNVQTPQENTEMVMALASEMTEEELEKEDLLTLILKAITINGGKINIALSEAVFEALFAELKIELGLAIEAEINFDILSGEIGGSISGDFGSVTLDLNINNVGNVGDITFEGLALEDYAEFDLSSISSAIFDILSGLEVKLDMKATFAKGSYDIANLLKAFDMNIAIPPIVFTDDEIIDLSLIAQMAINTETPSESIIKISIVFNQDCSFAKAGSAVYLYYQDGAIYLDLSGITVANFKLPQLKANLDIAQIIIDAIAGLNTNIMSAQGAAAKAAGNVAFASEETINYLGIDISSNALVINTTAQVLNSLFNTFNLGFELPFDFDATLSIGEKVELKITAPNNDDAEAIAITATVRGVKLGSNLNIDMSGLNKDKYNGNIVGSIIDKVSTLDINGSVKLATKDSQIDLAKIINLVIAGTGNSIDFPILIDIKEIGDEINFAIKWDFDFNNPENSKAVIELRTKDDSLIMGLYIVGSDMYLDLTSTNIGKVKMSGIGVNWFIASLISNIDLSQFDLDKILGILPAEEAYALAVRMAEVAPQEEPQDILSLILSGLSIVDGNVKLALEAEIIDGLANNILSSLGLEVGASLSIDIVSGKVNAIIDTTIGKIELDATINTIGGTVDLDMSDITSGEYLEFDFSSIQAIIYSFLRGVDFKMDFVAELKAGQYNIGQLINSFGVNMPALDQLVYNLEEDQSLRLGMRLQMTIDQETPSKSIIRFDIVFETDTFLAKTGSMISFYYFDGAMYLDLNELSIANYKLPQLSANIDIAKVIIDAVNGINTGVAFADNDKNYINMYNTDPEAFTFKISSDILAGLLSAVGVNLGFELPDFDLGLEIGGELGFAISFSAAGGATGEIENAIVGTLIFGGLTIGKPDMEIDITDLDVNKYSENILKALLNNIKTLDVSGELNFVNSQTREINLTPFINSLIAGQGLEIEVPIIINLGEFNETLSYSLKWILDYENIEKSVIEFVMTNANNATVFAMYAYQSNLYLDLDYLGIGKINLEGAYVAETLVNALNGLIDLNINLTDILNNLLNGGASAQAIAMAEGESEEPLDIFAVILGALNIVDTNINLAITTDLIEEILNSLADAEVILGCEIDFDVNADIALGAIGGSVAITIPDSGTINAGFALNINSIGEEVEIDTAAYDFTGYLDINAATLPNIIFGLLEGVDISMHATLTFSQGDHYIGKLINGFGLNIPALDELVMTFTEEEKLDTLITLQMTYNSFFPRDSKLALEIELLNDFSFGKQGSKIGLYYKDGVMYLDLSGIELLKMKMPQVKLDIDIATIIYQAIDGLNLGSVINPDDDTRPQANAAMAAKNNQVLDILGITINPDALKFAITANVIDSLLNTFGFELGFELPDFSIEGGFGEDGFYFTFAPINGENGVILELHSLTADFAKKGMNVDLSGLEINKYDTNVATALINSLGKMDIEAKIYLNTPEQKLDLQNLINGFMAASGQYFTLPIELNLDEMGFEYNLRAQWNLDFNNPRASKMSIELINKDNLLIVGLYLNNGSFYIDLSSMGVSKISIQNTTLADQIAGIITGLDLSMFDIGELIGGLFPQDAVEVARAMTMTEEYDEEAPQDILALIIQGLAIVDSNVKLNLSAEVFKVLLSSLGDIGYDISADLSVNIMDASLNGKIEIQDTVKVELDLKILSVGKDVEINLDSKNLNSYIRFDGSDASALTMSILNGILPEFYIDIKTDSLETTSGDKNAYTSHVPLYTRIKISSVKKAGNLGNVYANKGSLGIQIYNNWSYDSLWMNVVLDPVSGMLTLKGTNNWFFKELITWPTYAKISGEDLNIPIAMDIAAILEGLFAPIFVPAPTPQEIAMAEGEGETAPALDIMQLLKKISVSMYDTGNITARVDINAQAFNEFINTTLNGLLTNMDVSSITGGTTPVNIGYDPTKKWEGFFTPLHDTIVAPMVQKIIDETTGAILFADTIKKEINNGLHQLIRRLLPLPQFTELAAEINFVDGMLHNAALIGRDLSAKATEGNNPDGWYLEARLYNSKAADKVYFGDILTHQNMNVEPQQQQQNITFDPLSYVNGQPDTLANYFVEKAYQLTNGNYKNNGFEVIKWNITYKDGVKLDTPIPFTKADINQKIQPGSVDANYTITGTALGETITVNLKVLAGLPSVQSRSVAMADYQNQAIAMAEEQTGITVEPIYIAPFAQMPTKVTLKYPDGSSRTVNNVTINAVPTTVGEHTVQGTVAVGGQIFNVDVTYADHTLTLVEDIYTISAYRYQEALDSFTANTIVRAKTTSGKIIFVTVTQFITSGAGKANLPQTANDWKVGSLTAEQYYITATVKADNCANNISQEIRINTDIRGKEVIGFKISENSEVKTVLSVPAFYTAEQTFNDKMIVVYKNGDEEEIEVVWEYNPSIFPLTVDGNAYQIKMKVDPAMLYDVSWELDVRLVAQNAVAEKIYFDNNGDLDSTIEINPYDCLKNGLGAMLPTSVVAEFQTGARATITDIAWEYDDIVVNPIKGGNFNVGLTIFNSNTAHKQQLIVPVKLMRMVPTDLVVSSFDIDPFDVIYGDATLESLLPTTLDVNLNDGTTTTMEVVWDLSSVQLSINGGAYTVTATIGSGDFTKTYNVTLNIASLKGSLTEQNNTFSFTYKKYVDYGGENIYPNKYQILINGVIREFDVVWENMDVLIKPEGSKDNIAYITLANGTEYQQRLQVKVNVGMVDLAYIVDKEITIDGYNMLYGGKTLREMLSDTLQFRVTDSSYQTLPVTYDLSNVVLSIKGGKYVAKVTVGAGIRTYTFNYNITITDSTVTDTAEEFDILYKDIYGYYNEVSGYNNPYPTTWNFTMNNVERTINVVWDITNEAYSQAGGAFVATITIGKGDFVQEFDIAVSVGKAQLGSLVDGQFDFIGYDLAYGGKTLTNDGDDTTTDDILPSALQIKLSDDNSIIIDVPMDWSTFDFSDFAPQTASDIEKAITFTLLGVEYNETVSVTNILASLREGYTYDISYEEFYEYSIGADEEVFVGELEILINGKAYTMAIEWADIPTTVAMNAEEYVANITFANKDGNFEQTIAITISVDTIDLYSLADNSFDVETLSIIYGTETLSEQIAEAFANGLTFIWGYDNQEEIVFDITDLVFDLEDFVLDYIESVQVVTVSFDGVEFDFTVNSPDRVMNFDFESDETYTNLIADGVYSLDYYTFLKDGIANTMDIAFGDLVVANQEIKWYLLNSEEELNVDEIGAGFRTEVKIVFASDLSDIGFAQEVTVKIEIGYIDLMTFNGSNLTNAPIVIDSATVAEKGSLAACLPTKFAVQDKNQEAETEFELYANITWIVDDVDTSKGMVATTAIAKYGDAVNGFKYYTVIVIVKAVA